MDESAVSALYEQQVREFGEAVAAAKDKVIRELIERSGYEADASEDAEWRKHITVEAGPVPGSAIVILDGEPVVRITSRVYGEGEDLRWEIRAKPVPPPEPDPAQGSA